MLIFLGGVFFLFSTSGIASDIMSLGLQTPPHYVLGILLAGLGASAYAIAGFILRRNFWKAFFPILIVQMGLINLLARSIPNLHYPATLNAAEIARLQSRLDMDGYLIIAAMVLGYVCFLLVTITEGRRYFRVQAEIELATEVHQVLVPAIAAKIGDFEFYGRSLPSGEVGGDLIDLAGSEENWVAYVADVSGHGVAPGVVMGMVKSAARMLLTSGDDVTHLAPRLNEVLYPLKKPDMFVTFCFIAKTRDGLRAGLAGHPAILQFSATTNDVTRLDCPNMPLGILPSVAFETSDVPAESGSVFAMYTDGFQETANAAGEEFGIDRLQAEFRKHGKEPLDVIYRALLESVTRHGPQFDDRSLLLIRCL
jgi:sigma-B regulation protein RsbU (phosphoserine phosphatase)